jgi:hypothetical protein
MICQEYQHHIVLFLYEELSDRDKAGLEIHLQECRSCKEAFEAEKDLHLVLANDADAWDVPADLLVESRRALADELDRVERKRSWWRIPAFSVVFTPMRMLESAALVAMGLALGVYVTTQQVPPTPVSPPAETSAGISTIPRDATVSNPRIVNVNATTGAVEMAVEVVQPLRFQGNVADETVQQLLFSMLRNAENPGSRLRAVEVLSQEPDDQLVKEALIDALINDVNPEVRRQALEGLIPFAGQEDVRTAFIKTLENDQVAGIRIQAIEALSGFYKDEAVARTIQAITKDDDNSYVQMKGLQFVGNQR